LPEITTVIGEPRDVNQRVSSACGPYQRSLQSTPPGPLATDSLSGAAADALPHSLAGTTTAWTHPPFIRLGFPDSLVTQSADWFAHSTPHLKRFPWNCLALALFLGHS
jgi:hypothetical protein